MKHLILTSCTAIACGLLSPTLQAADRPPRLELRGTFGTAGFVDAERHDVSGLAFRFNVSPRFSVEPELLFMSAPLPYDYAYERGTDKDVVVATNFIYRLTPAVGRVEPYFISGIGYLAHREETAEWSRAHETLWLHFGGGLRIRVTERLSLLPEVRVGVDGGYATVSAAYGFLPARRPTEKESRAGDRPWEVARSLGELVELYEPGMTVHVTDATGRKLRGTLESISREDRSLTLRTSNTGHGKDDETGLVTLREQDVYRIDARTRDSLTNGIYIGAAVGAGLGLLSLAGCDCDGATYGALYLTGLGASLGMAIDALIPSTKIVYLASEPPSGVGLRLLPIVSRDKRGILMAIDF